MHPNNQFFPLTHTTARLSNKRRISSKVICAIDTRQLRYIPPRELATINLICRSQPLVSMIWVNITMSHQPRYYTLPNNIYPYAFRILISSTSITITSLMSIRFRMSIPIGSASFSLSTARSRVLNLQTFTFHCQV